MKLRELTCEGYKMFYGTMLISPRNSDPFTINGDWLFKPDTQCWYCKGRSFTNDICKQIAIFIPADELKDIIEI